MGDTFLEKNFLRYLIIHKELDDILDYLNKHNISIEKLFLVLDDLYKIYKDRKTYFDFEERYNIENLLNEILERGLAIENDKILVENFFNELIREWTPEDYKKYYDFWAGEWLELNRDEANQVIFNKTELEKFSKEELALAIYNLVSINLTRPDMSGETYREEYNCIAISILYKLGMLKINEADFRNADFILYQLNYKNNDSQNKEIEK
jgi:hypothetical protein